VTFARDILILAIRVYQRLVSPILAFITGPMSGCRFSPTCSHYAVEALKTHGALPGSWLAAKRVCRCHPWGGCGHDPVPRKNLKFQISNFKFIRHGS